MWCIPKWEYSIFWLFKSHLWNDIFILDNQQIETITEISTEIVQTNKTEITEDELKLQKILKRGEEVNSQDSYGYTALHRAVKFGIDRTTFIE